MEDEKKTFINWIKEHKTELIIAGISISAIIVVIVGIKNRKVLENTWVSLRKIVQKSAETTSTINSMPITETICVKEMLNNSYVEAGRISHNVSEHIRNLPEGWTASPQKIAMAAEYGFELLPGQTWVKSYRTGGILK